MRDGSSERVLRRRNATGDEDDMLAGPDLTPHLADALLATLEE